MTPEQKVFACALLGLSKGLLEDIQEDREEPSPPSDETASRLGELTRAAEVILEHHLALDIRLKRMEDELRALREELKASTHVASTSSSPEDLARMVRETIGRRDTPRPVRAVEVVESRENRDLVDLVECVRVQRGISRQQVARELGWPVDVLFESMRTELATLLMIAKVVNEAAPVPTAAPAPRMPLIPPPTTVGSKPSKDSKPAKQSAKSSKPAKRTAKKQPKAQAEKDEAPAKTVVPLRAQGEGR